MFQPHLNKSKSKGISSWDKIILLGDISSPQTSLDVIRQRIIDAAQEIFSACASLWLSENAFVTPHKGIPSSPHINKYSIECSPSMSEAIQKRRMVEKVSLSNDEVSKCYLLTSPIFVDNKLIGALSLERNDNRFTRSEKQLFKGLTIQTGITLASITQHMMDQWSVELLELVRTVSQQIINVHDIDEITGRVTQLILDTFNYYYVSIFTLNPDQKTLLSRHSAGPPIKIYGLDVTNSSQILKPKIGEGIIGRVAHTGIEILANNVSVSQYYRHIDGLPETKAEFALPLKIGEKIIGVIDVQSDMENYFSDLDSLVLRALADHIAMAINNAQLYTIVNLRATHLATVADISKAIASILDFDHLLNNIVSLLHIRFSIPRVNIFTVHPGRGKIIYRAGAGQLPASDEIIPNEFSIEMDASQGAVPWAVQNQQTVIVNNSLTDPRFHISLISPGNIKSELVIPLKYGDQILGVLDLQSLKECTFKADDVELLESLADYIAVAVRNANLYSSEQWRRQVSESVSEVAGLLSADIEISQVLEKILQELHKTLPCEVSAIWLLDDYEADTGMGQYTSPLRLASIFPGTDTLHELMVLNDLPGTLSPWMLEALDSQNPLIRQETSPYEPLGSFLNYPPDYSAIAAPLKAGNQTLGLMVLTHRTPGRYGSEAQAMTATFANYSAVAIKNTRLYEAAHDQAWVATVLLQVTEATQSITSMTELLETVVRIIPGLIGLRSCVLFIWDDITELFLPVSENGLDDNQKMESINWQIAPGEVAAFDQILEYKSPIIIDQTTLPSEIAAEKFSTLDVDHELLGLFPMVAQNNVLGAILINFAHADKYASSTTSYFEEKFAILQGIANQTAVAVENIRLLQSQEEEAYISVALLQVAQAIVSINELEEILNTIVRITPILVGVKRCVIYLCDTGNEEFILSQSHGISKQELSELPKQYKYDDHMFLKSIMISNSIGFGYLSNDDETPNKWVSYASTDVHIIQSLTDKQDDEGITRDDGYLKYKGRLLMGFPLSIKGNVLGIMIIEEGDTSRGIPSYHIRQRRQEIITGITQQTALAIHNDLLQHEVLGRERLEREMQLAREIQTAFLPETIPTFPGWDLDVRWQPARQVGGDFYDLINFEDGRVGFVLADVADKGMPAALFMTLVRTLIRAAAKDHPSPATILMQANDLLIPDAKQGMFVTVFVVIFSPNDGDIIYANAGHNPPIIHRATDNSIHELYPTGMALGVVDGIIINERTLSIMPGDRIILYTDGVTEAFSATEEMFGVERLLNVILASSDQSARGLLSHIQTTLGDFSAGAAQSDDLTLAALIRTKIAPDAL
jgi:sigma-B regulation protein RsbU (phosphoserine phosphatase)